MSVFDDLLAYLGTGPAAAAGNADQNDRTLARLQGPAANMSLDIKRQLPPGMKVDSIVPTIIGPAVAGVPKFVGGPKLDTSLVDWTGAPAPAPAPVAPSALDRLKAAGTPAPASTLTPLDQLYQYGQGLGIYSKPPGRPGFIGARA